VLESSRPEEPVPATLLPALVGEVQRRQRRRTWLVSAAAAAAAVLVTVGTVVAAQALFGDDGSAPPAASPAATMSPAPTTSALPMHEVRPLPVSADIALTSVAWGTRLDLTCTYDSPEDAVQTPRKWRYALVVRTSHGDDVQVASWVAEPGRTLHITAATAYDQDEIDVVEVQTPDGETLLRRRV
jgi:hypothetical protein